MFRTLMTTAWLTAAAGVSAAPAGDLDVVLGAAHAEMRALAKAAPSAADVGDPNSFGRNVKWAGLMQTGLVTLRQDCSLETPGPDDRCVTLNAAPAATTFNVTDIGRITLPGRAAATVLCQWVSPFIFYSAANTTGATATAQLRLTPSVRIESSVLADPTLIDPGTGLPYGGAMEIGLTGGYFRTRSMDPGETEAERVNYTRACIAGILSKLNLTQGMGFTPAQADDLFRQPMTIRINLSGTARLVESADVFYGLRFVAD